MGQERTAQKALSVFGSPTPPFGVEKVIPFDLRASGCIFIRGHNMKQTFISEHG